MHQGYTIIPKNYIQAKYGYILNEFFIKLNLGLSIHNWRPFYANKHGLWVTYIYLIRLLKTKEDLAYV